MNPAIEALADFKEYKPKLRGRHVLRRASCLN